MNQAAISIIRKDFRGIVWNRRLFPVLLIVPLVFTVFLPTVFLLMFRFLPQESGELDELLSLLPVFPREGDPSLAAAEVLFNHLLPLFFLMIPIMAASVMAASSFVGEKEKRTLETLLYCPLSLGEIFRAKVLASFSLSMLVSLLSFVLMTAVLEGEALLLFGGFLVPGASWLAILLLVSPAVSLIAVTLIVRGSAKAQSVEESQQAAVFLVLPVVLLLAGQLSGLLLVNAWVLLGIGAACGVLAWLLLRRAASRFTYESLLK